jgi:outer membrane protein assembly factor BamB
LTLIVISSGSLTVACAGLASPEGWASPVLADDLLLASHRDSLTALDAADLSAQWQFPTENDDFDVDALYGTPAVANDVVYIPGYDGNLYAASTSDGAAIWPEPFETGGSLVGGVAVAAETVYVGSSDNSVYAVNAESGLQEWSFETDNEIWSTPLFVDGQLYVTSLDGYLYVLDANQGTEIWSFKTDAGIASPPVVDLERGLVIVGGFDSVLRAIDIETHEQTWEVQANNWFWTTPLLADGIVYAGSLDGTVHAVDITSGEDVWAAVDVEAPVRSAPLIADDKLIIMDAEGTVHSLDPSDGAEAAAPLVLDSDVLSDGVLLPAREAEAGMELIVVTTDEDLVQIDVQNMTISGTRSLS